MSHAAGYLREAIQILEQLDPAPIEAIASLLVQTRERGGRLFVLGVGGRGGPRLARRVGLPQNRGHGSLRAKRQCHRTHRPHQR
ncbi:MAG: hypothetical protein KatS3mg060_1766 [Dehalococcoidia bacterium]|nr:MAG: hypothetical protein KatS3mg060_1766 [Dehalococcoidia bacterium]